MDIGVHGYDTHRHISLSPCTKLLFTERTPYRNIAVYCFTSLLHAQSATEPILRLLQPILVCIIIRHIVSYRANITANIANIGSCHCYTHCQLSSQYRGHYSQYWLTLLLHAQSVTEPILWRL